MVIIGGDVGWIIIDFDVNCFSKSPDLVIHFPLKSAGSKSKVIAAITYEISNVHDR